MNPAVFVRSVSKSYRRGRRSITALHDVSFDVLQGEIALLVGPSGSGKTTLINLIAGLDRPDAGKVVVDDMDLTGLSRSAAARYRNQHVGIVFQSYNLLPQLSALENILLPMIPKRRSDPRNALELLAAVGLADRSRHRPSELSGGEQQRVAIARALVNDPALILADEPVGNLDDENARRVLELLCKACRQRGKTLLLVTHDRELVHSVDQTFEIRSGWLTKIADAPTLLTSGLPEIEAPAHLKTRG
jgi:ABC-type lipoprotein export system ATPase subunit